MIRVFELVLQIQRGASYSFSGNISVEGCTDTTKWGQYCNQTVDPLSCASSDSYDLTDKISDSKINNTATENMVSCRTSFDTPCYRNDEIKVYSLEVEGIAEQLSIMAVNVSFKMPPSTNNGNTNGTNIMCFARHGALPSEFLHDYSGDISNVPLTIPYPKVGRWYFTVSPVNFLKETIEVQNTSTQVCYSVEWSLLECPLGKAGPNCTYGRYVLEVGTCVFWIFDYNMFLCTNIQPFKSSVAGMLACNAIAFNFKFIGRTICICSHRQ